MLVPAPTSDDPSPESPVKVVRLVHNSLGASAPDCVDLTLTIVQFPGSCAGKPGIVRWMFREGRLAHFSPLVTMEFFSSDGQTAHFEDYSSHGFRCDPEPATDSACFALSGSKTTFRLHWAEAGSDPAILEGNLPTPAVYRDPYEPFVMENALSVLALPFVIFEPAMGCKRTARMLAVEDGVVERPWYSGPAKIIDLAIEFEPLMGALHLKSAMCEPGRPCCYRRTVYLDPDGRFISSGWAMNNYGEPNPLKGWVYPVAVTQAEARAYLERVDLSVV